MRFRDLIEVANNIGVAEEGPSMNPEETKRRAREAKEACEDFAAILERMERDWEPNRLAAITEKFAEGMRGLTFSFPEGFGDEGRAVDAVNNLAGFLVGIRAPLLGTLQQIRQVSVVLRTIEMGAEE